MILQAKGEQILFAHPFRVLNTRQSVGTLQERADFGVNPMRKSRQANEDES